ncbi:MAG TPA: discoidin domain-containing protein, partial [Micromonosporaceae bacterium]|nr:discoidin domain-containing protein [Micromonosporaceae bacterium]
MKKFFGSRGSEVQLPPVAAAGRGRQWSVRWGRVALPTAAVLLVSVGLVVHGSGTALAADPALPRTGWTATADDAQSGYPASNVLDGSTSTYWHTTFGTTGPAFPHNVTIDMKADKTVTGLTYLPRQDTSNNGNIGGYRVEASTTGTSWTTRATGTWADTKTLKTVTFTAITARYVRLVATTEAGNRGNRSSAAEVNVLGTSGSTPTTSTGRWGSLINFPIVPAAAALLPNGKVVTWSANSKDRFGGSGQTYTSVLTPSTGAVTDRLVTNTG